MRPTQPEMLLLLTMMMMMMKSVEFDDDVALLLSVAGLVMGPHVTSESEIGGTDSAALRTSWRRIPAVEHSGRGATQLTVQIKRRRRLMWGGGCVSLDPRTSLQTSDPGARKNSKTTGEGCSR